MKAEKTDRKEQVQELTKKLEDGSLHCLRVTVIWSI